MRYWYSDDEDDYGTSTSEAEAEAFVAFGYREIDRIEFDLAMRALK